MKSFLINSNDLNINGIYISSKGAINKQFPSNLREIRVSTRYSFLNFLPPFLSFELRRIRRIFIPVPIISKLGYLSRHVVFEKGTKTAVIN